MKLLQYLMLGLLINILVQSCTAPPDVEDLMEAEVGKRLEKFKKQKMEDCWDYVYWEAERKVDSVMYMEIGSTLKKPLAVPQKPLRPEDSFTYVVELDTEKVSNFFPDTLVRDTLN